MSRLGAVIAVAFSALSLGCGAGDPDSTAPLDSAPGNTGPDAIDETPDGDTQGSETPGSSTDPDWALAFSIEGRTAPMTARAEIQVVEGQSAVHVAITGRTSGTDVMMIDLTFDGLENTLGVHSVEFSLPDDGEHVANGSLDGNWYYSQGGTIELSVNPDGEIQGRFDIVLAEGQMSAAGQPVVFEASDQSIPLDGAFSGSWVLNCHSHLAGHESLINGGEFCENLDF